MSTLTLEKIKASMAALAATVREPALREIVVTTDAYTKGDRLFPASRHRSRRLHKKLCRRFGGEFRRVPAIYRLGDVIVIHPARYAEVERLARPVEHSIGGQIFSTGIPVRWLR